MERHDHFESLAVGHVFGGLDAGQLAAFRSHLVTCDRCRRRVAELRDIAADLAAVERDERARAATKTQVRRQQEAPADDAYVGGHQDVAWGRTALAIGGVLLAIGLVFWNFHLRQTNATLAAALTTSESVLAELAEGQPLSADLAMGVTGFVVLGEEHVALDLATLPSLTPAQVIVIWFEDSDGTVRRQAMVPASRIEDGRLALLASHDGAVRMTVTVEDVPAGLQPEGASMVTADLAASPAVDASDSDLGA